jgi:hypothetical protein
MRLTCKRHADEKFLLWRRWTQQPDRTAIRALQLCAPPKSNLAQVIASVRQHQQTSFDGGFHWIGW